MTTLTKEIGFYQKSASQLPHEEYQREDGRRRQDRGKPAASRVELAEAGPEKRQQGCKQRRAVALSRLG